MTTVLRLFEITEKRCGVCREVKPLSDFHRYRGQPDGHTGECRACISARQRANRDPQKELARVQAWVAANRERREEYRRAYYRRNAGKVKAAVKVYYQANREKSRAWGNARRARGMAAAGTATAEQRAARAAYYGGLCWMCGERADTMDHVIPLARGGSNWPANLRPACKSCNSRKRTRKPGEF